RRLGAQRLTELLLDRRTPATGPDRQLGRRRLELVEVLALIEVVEAARKGQRQPQQQPQRSQGARPAHGHGGMVLAKCGGHTLGIVWEGAQERSWPVARSRIR